MRVAYVAVPAVASILSISVGCQPACPDGQSCQAPAEPCPDPEPCPGPDCTDYDGAVWEIYKACFAGDSVVGGQPQIDEGVNGIKQGPNTRGKVWAVEDTAKPGEFHEEWVALTGGGFDWHDFRDMTTFVLVQETTVAGTQPSKENTPPPYTAEDTLVKEEAWPSTYPSQFNSIPPGATVWEYVVETETTDTTKNPQVSTAVTGRLYRVRKRGNNADPEAFDNDEWVDHWVLHEDYRMPKSTGNPTYKTVVKDGASSTRTLAAVLNAMKANGALCETTSECSLTHVVLDWVEH